MRRILFLWLVFCLFADDTSIFDRDSFYFLIEYKARIDGTDTGDLIAKLFQVLDTPLDQREKKLDEDFVNFPFIKLFFKKNSYTCVPSLARKLLLKLTD